ncbi:uncharacterized protein LOC143275610 [Babylonia areolata]|uniref:uncharacterized protein LOC143275610 n=1 Tax=Babylonia areolata TaxID=304850 RepID=UPI003FD26654
MPPNQRRGQRTKARGIRLQEKKKAEENMKEKTKADGGRRTLEAEEKEQEEQKISQGQENLKKPEENPAEEEKAWEQLPPLPTKVKEKAYEKVQDKAEGNSPPQPPPPTTPLPSQTELAMFSEQVRAHIYALRHSPHWPQFLHSLITDLAATLPITDLLKLSMKADALYVEKKEKKRLKDRKKNAKASVRLGSHYNSTWDDDVGLDGDGSDDDFFLR